MVLIVVKDCQKHYKKMHKIKRRRITKCIATKHAKRKKNKSQEGEKNVLIAIK
jgi:hypothetical protein